jgi:hypothetical protein
MRIEVTRDEIHFGASLTVRFIRAPRTPTDGLENGSPTTLASLPIYRMNECGDLGSPSLNGAIVPFRRCDLLQISFSGRWWKPNAVKVGVGDRDAVTGGLWEDRLSPSPQNYLVCPDQDCLDGVYISNGAARQVRAAEPAATGRAQPGDERWCCRLRLVVYEPRPGLFPNRPPHSCRRPRLESSSHVSSGRQALIIGGLPPCRIGRDPHGIDAWDQTNFGYVDVYLVEQVNVQKPTGMQRPRTPIATDGFD